MFTLNTLQVPSIQHLKGWVWVRAPRSRFQTSCCKQICRTAAVGKTSDRTAEVETTPGIGEWNLLNCDCFI